MKSVNVLKSSNFENQSNKVTSADDVSQGSAMAKKKLLVVSNGNSNNSANSNNNGGRKSSFGSHPPASVARRNARERNRVKQVNTGFAVLRQRIPVLCGSQIVYGGSQYPDDHQQSSSKKNKMSKVETLRNAVEYIRNLEMLLNGDLIANGSSCSGEDEMETGRGHKARHLSSMPVPCHEETDQENVAPDVLLMPRSEASTSNDLMSSFYDSSSSVSPVAATGSSSSPSWLKDAGSGDQHQFKQELIGSLACFSSSSSSVRQADDELLPSLLLHDPLDQQANEHDEHQEGQQQLHEMSENSLLDSINTWWLPAI